PRSLSSATRRGCTADAMVVGPRGERRVGIGHREGAAEATG
ncbi:unnamed protein product, partial [Iphiclides podalirius]